MDIEAIPHARIEILIYDQASLASIEQFAGELTAKYPLINGFVFNAGFFHPQKDAVTKDGYPAHDRHKLPRNLLFIGITAPVFCQDGRY
jgi:short-subunit dehydrogenase involved in D-alanine esterification of teichoic acids